MGGNWECNYRLSIGVGSIGTQDAHYDAAFGFRHNAPVFWGAFREQAVKSRGFRDYFYLFDPIHRFFV
jgi:hypothetical protein